MAVDKKSGKNESHQDVLSEHDVSYKMPIHLVDAEVFHWISENVDLLSALEEKSEKSHSVMKVITIYHNLEYLQFDGNRSNHCWDIPVWTNQVEVGLSTDR